jgi:hypothetical protein
MANNPSLPPETKTFQEEPIGIPYIQLGDTQWQGALHATEVDDKKQQIKLRPWFAGGVFLLLAGQNVGIWFVVVWALQAGQLNSLQLIFSTLIAGTLTQSYLILRFITNKVFSDIDYHNH